MKNKCHCYHTQKKTRYTYNQCTGSPIPHDIEVGVCWGTKETDECNCGGDETKCNFYPEVREKAMADIGEDNLIVTYDCCSPDAPTLCIARKEGNKVRILNTIQGEEDSDIINISSSRDRMSQPQTESYTAAKGGIAALTHALAVSLAGRVRVNSVSPGWIDNAYMTFSQKRLK